MIYLNIFNDIIYKIKIMNFLSYYLKIYMIYNIFLDFIYYYKYNIYWYDYSIILWYKFWNLGLRKNNIKYIY